MASDLERAEDWMAQWVSDLDPRALESLLGHKIAQQAQRIEELEREVEALRSQCEKQIKAQERFNNYAQHLGSVVAEESCGWFRGDPCTCGLDSILNPIEGEKDD